MITNQQIFEALPSITDALQAMHDGLLRLPGHEHRFVVDMDKYGKIKHIDGENVCFGCAATATIVHTFGRRFYGMNGDGVHHSESALHLFEVALNAARLGVLTDLLMFYAPHQQFTQEQQYRLLHIWAASVASLLQDSYKRRLPQFQEAINSLKQQLTIFSNE